jgi:hypothetical protein
MISHPRKTILTKNTVKTRNPTFSKFMFFKFLITDVCVDTAAIRGGRAGAAGYSWQHPLGYLKRLCQLLCFSSHYVLHYSSSVDLKREKYSTINDNFLECVHHSVEISVPYCE